MIDWYGNWFEEQDYNAYPIDEWCYYDYMAVWIREQSYNVQTTMENLISIIFIHFDGALEDGDEYGEEFSIEGCKQFVKDSGGLAEFDYYC